MTDAKRLYERDFVLWAQEQAAALRAAAQGTTNLQLDWENLAEEIDSLGVSQRAALSSQLRRIIRHLIKLQCSPAQEPRRGWRESIRDARGEIQDLLEVSPSLAPEVARLISRQTARAIREAIGDLEDYGELERSGLAAGRPQASLDLFRFSEEQVLGDWFPPEPREQGGAA